MNEQPTNVEILDAVTDVLEAVHSFASTVDERFNGLEGRVTNIESTMATKADLAGMATKADLAGMVTKDYLDDKLADLHSDIVSFVKRRVPGWSGA